MHSAGEAQWGESDLLTGQEPLARRGGVPNSLSSGCSTSGGGWCILQEQGGLAVVASADTNNALIIRGQVYNVSILRRCIILLADFGGKGER